MTKVIPAKSSSDRKDASLEFVGYLICDVPHKHLPVTLLPCNFICHFECMNAICVLHFQRNKSFVHSVGRGIPITGLMLILRQFILTHLVKF